MPTLWLTASFETPPSAKLDRHTSGSAGRVSIPRLRQSDLPPTSPFIPANVDGGASVLTSFDRPSFLSFVRFVLPNKHGRASQWTLYYGSPKRVSPSAEKALDLLGFMVQNGCNAG